MEDKIIILIQKFLKGTITPKELELLQEYYNLNLIKPSSLDNYYAQQWNHAENIMTDDNIEKVKKTTWKRIKKLVNEDREIGKTFILPKIWKIAAIFISLLILSGIGYSIFIDRTEVPSSFIISADKGQKSKIELPDGSVVYLNSASEVICLPNYGKINRMIKLSGEAYFDVKSNPEKPFIVLTSDNLEVKALGTKFNIKSYDEDEDIVCTLLSGKLVVQKDENEYTLFPNEMLSFNKEKNEFLKTMSLPQDVVIGWQANQLVFDNEKIEDIAKTLERTYDVRIVFESDDIKNIRYSGTIKNKSLEYILKLMEVTAPIQYLSLDSVIILKNKKKSS